MDGGKGVSKVRLMIVVIIFELELFLIKYRSKSVFKYRYFFSSVVYRKLKGVLWLDD